MMYLSVYLGSTMLAIVTTPIVIRIAKRLNIVDPPDVRKVHSKPIPRIGGVAIFASMIGLVIPVLFLPGITGDSLRLLQPKITVVLCAAGLIFIVGLMDDIRGLRVYTKLAFQVIAAMVVCLANIRIESIAVTNFWILEFGWFSWPVTLLWIIGITNAVNLSDGLDGLAAGISAITCGVLAILAVHNGNVVMAIVMLALLGSLTGFLFFNFDPARVFMGDSGSLFLGFTIASASVMCAAETKAIFGLALPILALGIPILDTLFSMLRRFLERRSLFAPDRSHFHHRLLALGFRQRHAVITAYLVTLLVTGLGMLMLLTRNTQTVIIFICVLLLLILAFRLAGSVRLSETMSAFKRKYMIFNQKKQEIKSFESIELYFRQARIFEQWWQAVCFAADKMGFVRGLLPIIKRDKSRHILLWEKNGQDIRTDQIVKMTVPVRDRRAGSQLALEVQVQTNGSLESAGHRLMLFSRLIDEYNLANLAQ
jgi:UDP-GlcNAc:undecaprenyl-phosphate GlcNAc-1-phosphate transferase